MYENETAAFYNYFYYWRVLYISIALMTKSRKIDSTALFKLLQWNFYPLSKFLGDLALYIYRNRVRCEIN